jgi:hypothetical protein
MVIYKATQQPACRSLGLQFLLPWKPVDGEGLGKQTFLMTAPASDLAMLPPQKPVRWPQVTTPATRVSRINLQEFLPIALSLLSLGSHEQGGSLCDNLAVELQYSLCLLQEGDAVARDSGALSPLSP